MRRMMTIIFLAVLGMSSFSFIINISSADTQVQGTWVRMRGIIKQWDSDPVFGFVEAHAGMVDKNGTYREWARVHAIWSNETHRLNCTGIRPPPENFTLTHYSARLVNLTDVAFNYSGYDFYISGLWNVIKITTTFTVIQKEDKTLNTNFNRTFESVAINASGELGVLLYPEFQFELNIKDVGKLTGAVIFWFIRHIEIKVCDVDDDGKVDIIDLVRVARRYRTAPGMFNYDQKFDFNFDDVIDIGDLTTVAANIEG